MKIPKVEKVLIATFLVAIMFISGFSVATNAMVPAKPAGTTGTVYIAMQDDISNFNIFDLASNTVWKANVIGWDWDSLALQDVDGTVVPALAQNWSFNTSSLTLTIYLRHGVKFSDGTPMTAKDVIFSYYALRYGTTYSGEAFTVPFDTNNNGVVNYTELSHYIHYINPYELTIQMRQVYASFFLMTLGIAIIPMHIWMNHLVPYVTTKGVTVPIKTNLTTGATTGVLNTRWNSVQATIGTGPYYYAGGVAGAYRVEKLNPNYWGKNFVTPSGYHIYPQNVTELYFKIYSDVNTAVLALQSGAVNYIAWALLPSQVRTLAPNPHVKLTYSPSDGYFYLAFNLAKRPMNSINFRHAISYLINKAKIVQDYMGGYGQAGDSSVPPFFSAWYNSTMSPKYYFDPSVASNILNASGYKIGPTGWRTMPDGTPMAPITILTPPANYDPIRVKVGQFVSEEMRKVGIATSTKPIDFGALVAQFTSFNYQMLTLGWVNFPTAINALSAIFGENSNSNNLAFWPANYTNPAYPKVKSLADAQTSKLAVEFNKYINDALTTFDVQKQIYDVKVAQGIVYKADPQDVLYYDLNIEATTTNWVGWMSWYGSVYNLYSLARLHTGVASVAVPTTHEAIVAGINAPSTVLMNDYAGLPRSVTTVPVSVFVANNFGVPIAGATVKFAPTTNVTLSSYNGTTDSNGLFTVHATGNAPGFSVLKATVTYKSMSASASALIKSVDLVPNFLYINAQADKLSLMPGQSTAIHVSVVDRNGEPVSGATVSVETTLLGYGTISPATAVTGSNGQVTLTYTAVSTQAMKTKYLNANLLGNLVIKATKAGYLPSNKVNLKILNYNPNPSTWHTVTILGATNYTVNQTSLSTTVMIQTINANNVPISDTVTVMPTMPGYFTPFTVTTNAAGFANFTVTFKAGMPTAAVGVKIVNSTVGNAIANTLTVAYVKGTAPSDLYGGYISYNSFSGTPTNFIASSGSGALMTVHLYNTANQPVAGKVPIGVIVSSVTEGSPLWFIDPAWTNPASFCFDSLWEAVAIYVNTTYSGAFSTSGVFVSQLDNITKDPTLAYWLSYYGGFTGIPSAISVFEYVLESGWYGIYLNNSYVVNGTGTYVLSGVLSPAVDRVSNIYVIPYSYTWYPNTPGIYPKNLSLTLYNFNTIGSEALMSQVGIQRAGNYQLASFGVNNQPTPPLLPWWSSTPALPYAFAGSSVTVYAKLVDQNNAPVVGAALLVSEPMKSQKISVIGTTASDGTIKLSVPTFNDVTFTPQLLYISSALPLFPGAPLSVSNYAYTPYSWDLVQIISSTQIMIVPHQLFVTASIVGSDTVTIGSQIHVLVKVTDELGNPVAGASVSLGSNAGSVTSASGASTLTGTDGTVVFTVDTSTIVGTPFSFLKLSASATKAGYAGSSSTVYAAAYAKPPILAISSLYNGITISTSSYNVTGTAYAALGISAVYVSLDGATPAPATLTHIGTGAVAWTYPLTGLTSGQHTIVVKVVSNSGVATQQELKFTYTPAVTTKVTKAAAVSGAAIAGIIVGIIGIIIAIIAIGIAVRKPKQPPTMPPEETKETPPPETPKEETPSEEKPSE